MKNRGNENGRIDGRRYFIACLTRRKSSSLSLETNAPSPVHWDGSSEPRPSIHPSIHLSIHYFTSFIQAPESNHNSPPIEQKETKPIFDRRPPFSPSFFRLQPSYLFVTRRYPLFSRIRQRNIVESEIQIPIIIRTIRSRYFYNDLRIQINPLDDFYESLGKSIVFFSSQIHEETRPVPSTTSIYYLKNKNVYYRNRIDAFQFPSPRYWNETETRKARTRRAARDREGSGGEKKPFPIVATIFKSQTRGRRRGQRIHQRGE